MPRVDLSKVRLIKADHLTYHWRCIPAREIEKAMQQGENILLIDPFSKQIELLPTFILESYLALETFGQYNQRSIPATPDKEYWLSPYEQQLISRFHYSWLNELRDYVYTDSFKHILQTVMQYRSREPVYPESAHLLTAFLRPFNAVSSLWLGDQPESIPGVRGVAFASEGPGLSPWGKIIQKSLRPVLDKPDDWLLRPSLEELLDQGILLLNAELTTATPPGLWEPFIRQVLLALTQVTPSLPILVLGPAIHRYQHMLPPMSTYSVEHPSSGEVLDPHMLELFFSHIL